MTHIVAISAKKQGGKTTAVNFLHGHEMKRHDMTGTFDYHINNEGQLVVRTVAIKDGKEVYDEGILDVFQKTYAFIRYAEHRIWPFIKAYNFADTLKDIAVEVLGLDYEQCHGTDAQKNSPTGYRWEEMPGVVTPERVKFVMHLLRGSEYIINNEFDPAMISDIATSLDCVLHEPGPMTGREVLQYVGTDVFRRMNQNVWVDCCLRQIENDQSEIAVIGDCRFASEVEAIRKANGKVIRLTRKFADDKHESETALDGYTDFDAVIDNANMSISETNSKVLELLALWGVTDFIRPVLSDRV